MYLQALHNLATVQERDSNSDYQNCKKTEPACYKNIPVRTHPIPKAKSLMITKTTISRCKLQMFCDKGKQGVKSI